ncbi:MAG: RNA polymerase sigma factor (sigma-70 family) [Mariniblastus sp.]|jgi:RNA polymerase sigma factor (sigma-70 family)
MNSNPSNREVDARSSQPLETLFHDAQGELLGTLYYLIGNMEDAKDALQETFLKCWRKQEQVDSIENLKAWVFRIALNTGRDIRKTAWQRRRQPLAEDAVMFSTTDSPDAALVRNEQINRLSQAVMKLRPKEQEVFLLRQNGGLTYEQIAHATGLPLGTVKTRMRSALSQLRETVGDQS